MLKLATLIDNPGEPSVESRYRDPKQLKALGYNGLVIYDTTALSGVEGPESLADGEMRRWITHHFDHIRQVIDAARQADLDVYLSYDTLALARDVVDRHVTQLVCRNRPNVLCPASDLALDLSVKALEALMLRYTDISGVVLRFGDTDAARLPHLVGNDLLAPHCPRCSGLGRADRIVRFIERFHDLVVRRHDKRLIVRAWNVRPNGMHDSVELAQRVVERLPGGDNPRDDRFILSFKFTHTDFWRYQRWNPCSLTCGDRPVMYELQCQREFEGKGGVPNWQAPLWRDGHPEAATAGEPAGLANVADRVNLAGLWAWVRGGGWGGPFVKNETWIDANVFAVPRLADDPRSDVDAIARDWVRQRLHITDDAVAEAIHAILRDSTDVVRKAFYIGPFARRKATPWHPNADWIQDDLIDASAAMRMLDRLSEDDLQELVQEKQDAVEQLAHGRAALYHLETDHNRKTLEPMINVMVYAESLYEALRDLLAGLAAYRRFQRHRDDAHAQTARQKLLQAQSHWNHHTQRHGSLPGCATAFRESHFWELTQQILNDVTEARA
jgi:hypothetical protein